MKLIRMLKTMAGPDGVWHPGMKPFTVDDETAEMLVNAEAAEIVATITPAVEAATVDPVTETADAPQATAKPRRAKKAGK
ncbi:MAG: hypothetical protein R3A44_44370 [Caldilineaceae bacterium]